MTEVPSMRSHEEDLRKIPSSSLMTQVKIITYVTTNLQKNFFNGLVACF